MNKAKEYNEIAHAEWLLYEWIEVSTYSDLANGWQYYLRGKKRPLDEAIRLAGGSIKDLQPYLWALEEQQP